MKTGKKHKKLFLGMVVVGALGILGIGLFVQSRKAIEIATQMELGNRYLSELDYEQAIASYRQVLEIEPQNKEAGMGLAEAYEASQMYAYAEAVYGEMLKNDETQADVYEKMVKLYIRQGKYEEAEKLLDEAVNLTVNVEIEQLRKEAHITVPAMNYGAGRYEERLKLEFLPAEEKRTIYFTLDGTNPSAGAEVYDGSIILPNGVTTVKAIAVSPLGFQSDVMENVYDIAIPDRVVEISEPVIERIIREEMEIPDNQPIYNDDVERVQELYIVGRELAKADDLHSVIFENTAYTIDGYGYSFSGFGMVQSLQDLKEMPFLERVVVAYQTEVDISGLSGLSQLRELSLIGNQLENGDIAVLSELKDLEKLNLGWNSIDNIGALSELENLTSLGVWGNNISDITVVKNMPILEYLDVSNNRISDITPVKELTELKELWLYHNQVSDISSISGLSKLTVLMVYGNPIANPGAVQSIYSHLQRLDVDLLGLGDTET